MHISVAIRVPVSTTAESAPQSESNDASLRVRQQRSTAVQSGAFPSID